MTRRAFLVSKNSGKKETVQDTKGQCGHGKEVQRCDNFRWSFRKVDQRFADTGLVGTFRIQRKTVLSEMSKPSIFNSP